MQTQNPRGSEYLSQRLCCILRFINFPPTALARFNAGSFLSIFLALPDRLLSQLDETERAFDEFWVRHQTKLEQCLQLRHFEHNYREVSWTFFILKSRILDWMSSKLERVCVFLVQVRALLDQVSEKLATFSEVGISPAHADHIFIELTTYEEKVCVSHT